MENNNTNKLTYTVLEVSKLLGISKNSTYKAINDGDIPSVKIGSRILIPRSQIDKLLNS